MSAGAAALRLGTTVAKTAADIWLGGRRQQERHLPLAELVRVRVPGLRLQRGVKRQFGQITYAVFDRLEMTSAYRWVCMSCLPCPGSHI
ncbi:NACHT N-terminal Helical domain 1-containing protein [Streptomyces coeruleorubidus]